jgi:UDP-N-acetylglucosamine 2-epimerase (non-hydrolysing)
MGKNPMLKILTIFGTRPEVIKMAPVIKELKKHSKEISCCICITGQHKQMVDNLLALFDIKPDYDLNIMQQNQTLEQVTSLTLNKASEVIQKEKPDYLLVQGDATTAMASVLAAFYQKVKIAHIEAGLRTGDKFHPYPEEINRRIIDSLSDLYFTHTESARQNLISEGVPAERIEITGNTVIDVLLEVAGKDFNPNGTELEKFYLSDRKTILVTAHRRESFGEPLINICAAVKEIAFKFSSQVNIIYPVHLNPNVQGPVYSILNGIKNVFLIQPLEYFTFVQLMKKAYFILTDSGGIQEEGPSLGKPVLVLRKITERPEAVEAGTVELVGTETDKIVERVSALLEDNVLYERMRKAINPYGDGKASQRIVRRLLQETQNNCGL